MSDSSQNITPEKAADVPSGMIIEVTAPTVSTVHSPPIKLPSGVEKAAEPIQVASSLPLVVTTTMSSSSTIPATSIDLSSEIENPAVPMQAVPLPPADIADLTDTTLPSMEEVRREIALIFSAEENVGLFGGDMDTHVTRCANFCMEKQLSLHKVQVKAFYEVFQKKSQPFVRMMSVTNQISKFSFRKDCTPEKSSQEVSSSQGPSSSQEVSLSQEISSSQEPSSSRGASSSQEVSSLQEISSSQQPSSSSAQEVSSTQGAVFNKREQRVRYNPFERPSRRNPKSQEKSL